MSVPLDNLRDLFGPELEGLAGGVVSGEIPLSREAVNRWLAGRLAASKTPITAADIEPLDRDRVTVHLRPRPPIPALTLDVLVEHQPQLPSDSTLGLRWALRGLGPLAILAGPLMSYFKALPSGWRSEGDRLYVDIHEVLRRQHLGELIPFLTAIRIGTRAGKFVVQFELRR